MPFRNKSSTEDDIRERGFGKISLFFFTYLSPRWGLGLGEARFSIHLSPRWGFIFFESWIAQRIQITRLANHLNLPDKEV